MTASLNTGPQVDHTTKSMTGKKYKGFSVQLFGTLTFPFILLSSIFWYKIRK